MAVKNYIRDLRLKSLYLDRCSVRDTEESLDLGDFKNLKNLHLILKTKTFSGPTLPSHLNRLTV